jgi:mannose-6-phosphate isomerase-like protein (cupin superfamily)
VCVQAVRLVLLCPSPSLTPPHLSTPLPSPPPLSQVKMPPRSVKTLEDSMHCTQVFVVVASQPKALRVDIGPQSYLLGPGDHFYVPPNTSYRFFNFSDTPAEVSFVVIKPGAGAAAEKKE